MNKCSDLGFAERTVVDRTVSLSVIGTADRGAGKSSSPSQPEEAKGAVAQREVMWLAGDFSSCNAGDCQV